MYIVKRVNKATERVEYLCADTARKFWLPTADKRWMIAFASQSEAERERKQAFANGVTSFYYLLDTMKYSQRDKKYLTARPLQ